MERFFKCMNCDHTFYDDSDHIPNCVDCGSNDIIELHEIKRLYNLAWVERCFDETGW